MREVEDDDFFLLLSVDFSFIFNADFILFLFFFLVNFYRSVGGDSVVSVDLEINRRG